MPLSRLPVDDVLPRLVAALRDAPCALLRAPTGAGKTTRVPPALLDAGLAGTGQVIVVEPRRLAARAAARRIAFERGVEPGGEVGWQVRFERRAGPTTRILVVTEGILVRRLQDDPFLEGVGAVVLDEFHERNLDGDLALAMTRKVQREARPDLQLVAMSATLDAAPLARFLGGCPVVESQGRLHPVTIRHAPREPREPLEAAVARAVSAALDEVSGDVLVFLPGVGEIRRAHEALDAFARRRELLLVDLYGDLSPEAQDAALRPAAQRKVILATNVAESSVTIEGVAAVVDSGLRRAMRFDPAVGLDRLELGRVARSSAEQRAGRAGRTGPGLCVRLWSAADDRALGADEEPEVRRVDLAGAVLQLRAWGEADVGAFPWFEAPTDGAVDRALALLRLLGAVDARGVTDAGRSMARIPAHPRVARLLLEGHRLGHPEPAALAAALLSDRDPFLRDPRRRAAHASSSDVLDRVHALGEREAGGARRTDAGEIHDGGARFVLRARDQLLRLVESAAGRTPRATLGEDEALLRSVLAAFPDRVARRRGPEDRRAVMVGGRGVRLAESSAVLLPELFVCVDVEAGGAESLVRLASGVERAWLPAASLREDETLAFDAESERVVARKRLLFEDLVLEETATAASDAGAVERCLAEAAAAAPQRALALDDPEVESFLARVACLRGWCPEIEIPALDPIDLLPELCAGRRSFAELRRAPLLDHSRALLGPTALAALDREAPERLRVPSGSAIRLRYAPGAEPVLAARIQECFGLAETPRVARGRVPVVMHLLAPNQRPQQITRDLRSFWDGEYQQIRKQLRARYPRHAWPEDPWNAPAERRPGRPKRR